jgi:hypothetical protein
VPKLNKYGEIIDESGGPASESPSRSVSSSPGRVGPPSGPGGRSSSSSPGIAIFLALLVIGAIIVVAVKQHEGNNGAQMNTAPQPSTIVSPAVAWPFDSESLAPNLFVAAVNGRVEGVVFFESGAEIVPKPSRVYATEFQQERLRYLNWELALRHPSRSYRQSFTIVAFLYSPDGSIRGQQQSPTYLEPDWTSSYHSNRWGQEAGPWLPGTYRLSLFVDGVKIAAGSVSIKSASSPDAGAVHRAALSHLVEARTLYEQRQYKEAVAECDAAVRDEPDNADAAELRSQILRTMAILGIQ